MVQQELRLVYMLMIHVDLQQQGMSVVHAIDQGRLDHGVDQRAANTGCMKYVARAHMHMADILRHEQRDLTLLALHCAAC